MRYAERQKGMTRKNITEFNIVVHLLFEAIIWGLKRALGQLLSAQPH